MTHTAERLSGNTLLILGGSEDLELDPVAENGPPHPHLQSGPLDPLELPLSLEWLLEEEKQ